MAPVKINPERLQGPWAEGYVLDRHTQSSTPSGYIGPHLQYDTRRTELGELVYRLKYRGDKKAIPIIVETAEQFIKSWKPPVDCIVTPPPSDMTRKSQPVTDIVRELAGRIGAPICEDAVIKGKPTAQMKNIDNWSERQKVLQEAIRVGSGDLKGKRILLFDDLIESGSTLRRVAEVLVVDAGAAAVFALVLTRTK